MPQVCSIFSIILTFRGYHEVSLALPMIVAGFQILFSLIITLSPTLNGGKRVDARS
jgi:hypothetical protein